MTNQTKALVLAFTAGLALAWAIDAALDGNMGGAMVELALAVYASAGAVSFHRRDKAIAPNRSQRSDGT